VYATDSASVKKEELAAFKQIPQPGAGGEGSSSSRKKLEEGAPAGTDEAKRAATLKIAIDGKNQAEPAEASRFRAGSE